MFHFDLEARYIRGAINVRFTRFGPSLMHCQYNGNMCSLFRCIFGLGEDLKGNCSFKAPSLTLFIVRSSLLLNPTSLAYSLPVILGDCQTRIWRRRQARRKEGRYGRSQQRRTQQRRPHRESHEWWWTLQGRKSIWQPPEIRSEIPFWWLMIMIHV